MDVGRVRIVDAQILLVAGEGAREASREMTEDIDNHRARHVDIFDPYLDGLRGAEVHDSGESAVELEDVDLGGRIKGLYLRGRSRNRSKNSVGGVHRSKSSVGGVQLWRQIQNVVVGV